MPEEQHVYLGVAAIIASPKMRQLMEMLVRVARMPATVLITGETGTGKEIVARAVHHYSLRANKPWVDFNCAALPEHLVESELFGHEKGAFSGADAVRPGLFEMAHSGTLFLDEVGELDARMQVKLLRVLDGVPYYRVGGQKKIAADVRIVAATNQDLEKTVAARAFRADLFHRLNQCRVHVPPLRERREDIVPIAEFFLRQYAERAGFTAGAKALLERHSWPGNIRELRNVVTRAVIASPEYSIEAGDLQLGDPAALAAAVAPGETQLAGLERSAILSALEKTGGHHQKTADLLGISRKTLGRKLKQYRAAAQEEDSVYVT
jgi:two-component system, NtrC family, response regulator AtoC